LETKKETKAWYSNINSTAMCYINYILLLEEGNKLSIYLSIYKASERDSMVMVTETGKDEKPSKMLKDEGLPGYI
jgi:hypothetical protein